MSRKKFFIVLTIVAALLFVGFVLFKITSKKATAPTNETDITFNQVIDQQSLDNETNDSNDNNIQGSIKLTSVEVAKHNAKDDCWTIINDKVYDITKYIPNHSGGEEILRACGIDATTLFIERTTRDGQPVGSGTPHSENAQDQLNQFLLGDLK